MCTWDYEVSQTQPYENWFWKKNNISLIQSRVTSVSPEINKLQLDNGKHISYKTHYRSGSKYNMLNWPGKDLNGVSGYITNKIRSYC